MPERASSFFDSLWHMSSLILIVMLIVFIFLRVQSKKKQQRIDLLNSIVSGSKIITVGGIIGTVVSVKENSLFLKVSDNVNIEISRDAVYVILREEDQQSKQQ